MSYKIIADLEPGVTAPRIGSRGVAKIYGKHIVLGLYLFRKPLSAVRQMLGI
jgi:hypothetical protein